jgi:iron complex outermembrane receptor protein
MTCLHRPDLLAALWVLWLLGANPLAGQQTPPRPGGEPPEQANAGQGAVREIGGRLVVSDETTVVAPDPDSLPRNSTIATKIDAPLLETPRSISIVDRRMHDGMGATNITQAHDFATGVTPLNEHGPGFARGFPIGYYDLRRDGLRTFSWSVRELAAVERVQYLRGPAAILYGDGSPGGLVNMVLKKPLPAKRYELTTSGGSSGFGRVAGDVTGPLTSDRRLRYRVVGASEWLDNGFDNGERRLTLLPTVAFDVGPRATVTLDTEWYQQRGRAYRHVVPATAAAQRGDFSGYPWDLNTNGPDDHWSGSNLSPGLRVDAGLGARSSLHAAVRYTRINGEIEGQGLSRLAEDGRTALRFQYHEVSRWHEYQTDTFAATAFRTGAIEHRLVAGVEAGLSTVDSLIGTGPATPLDIFEPQYSKELDPAARPTRNDVRRLGAYVSDQLEIGGRVILTPALRWGRLEIDDHVAPAGETQSIEHVVSPGIGVVVLPRSGLSLYANYAEGFEPPTPGQYLEDGRTLAPASSAAIESGAKLDLPGRRASLTVAAFRIRRTNVPEADPRGFFRPIGEAASHGLELDAAGTILPGLIVRGGYAWMGTEITRDASGFAGRELPNAPRHKGQVWMRYRVARPSFKGLTVAAGLVHVADRFTARDNVVVAPSYTRVDGSVSREIAGPRLVLAVVAQNVTNRRYVTSGAGAVFFAGPPRRVAVQLATVF